MPGSSNQRSAEIAQAAERIGLVIPLGGRRMSANGTSATFTRRGLMSGSGPFSDIIMWPAYVPD